MRTTRPSRSPSAFRRSPLFAALAGALAAPAAYAACTPNAIPPNLVFCVTNTNASGTGSLAQAVADANNGATCSGTNPTIGFAIPGTGPFVIQPSGTLSFFCSGVLPYNPTIDGTSQAGYTPNTSSSGFNSAIQIIIDGAASSSPTGISMNAFSYGGALTVKGVEVRNFTYGGFANALSGPINLLGSKVTGNTHGIDPDGIDPDGFMGAAGISAASIGGVALADRNVMRNINVSVNIAYGGSVDIRGNLIGTDDSGTASGGPGTGVGINLAGASAVNIAGNVISGANGAGIVIDGSNAISISGNKIGEGSGGGAVPNTGHGIISSFSSNVTITDNTIAFNNADGINLPSGSTHEIRRNRIHSNGGKAISLGGSPGQLPNDTNDPDTGANDLQNYPVISSVLKDGTNTTINWSLNSTAGTSFLIEFFSNPSASATPQATNYLDPAVLGFTQAGGTTGAAANTIGGTTVIPGSHDFITATATNTNTSPGATSELTLQALAVGGTLNPTSLNFGNIVVNASSGQQNATINSIGASPYVISFLHGSSLCYGGPPAPPPICSSGGFICSTTCNVGQSYTGGSSCTISATFAPTVVGPQNTTIYICDNAGGNPRTLTLSGTGIAPPPPTVAPSSHNFGSVEVTGTSAVQSFTVTNPSPGSVTLSGFTVTGPFAIVANTCGASMAASSSCTVDARFNPSAVGGASGAITATASSGGINIPLSGTGAPHPAPTPSPASINFGSVQVGGSSTIGTFTLTNTANVPVSLSAFSTLAPFSLVATTCGTSLAVGASCGADVKFMPTAVGPATGTISNATGNGTVAVSLSGNGTASPPPTIAPLNHEFGSVFVGTSSVPQTFTINNPALVPATLGPIVVTPPFSLFGTTCGTTLAAGASCTADVKFSPAAVGPASGSVSTTVSGGTLSAALAGTGAPPPQLTITPPSFNFGSIMIGQSSGATTFVVRNPGAVTLSLAPLTTSGPFHLVSTTCGTSLASNSSCDANVRFTPTAPNIAMGALTATSSFGPSSAQLTGDGVRAPAVQLATDPIEFGSLTVGTPPVQRTLRITNTGNDVLGINSITVPRPFTLANACGVSLGSGDSCTFTVGFDPTEVGDFAATLVVSTNAPNAASIQIRVHAQVQARPEPLVRVSPRIIGFGDRMGGTQSPAQRITLSNEGGVAANLNLSMTSAHFVVVNSGCGATLAPQRSCDVDVAFQPQGFGPKRGTFVVSSNSPDSPIRVELSGAGCRPVLTTQGRGTSQNNCAP